MEHRPRCAVKGEKVEGGERQGEVSEFLKGSNRRKEDLAWLWDLE